MNESGPIRKTQKDRDKQNGYIDISRLSSGVWSAVHCGKLCVLKTPGDDSSDSYNLLRRECQIARNLSHPNIVQTFGFEEHTPVGPAIVMEYVDGPTLTEFLLSNPTPALRKKIFFQILDALEYLHSKNIVHDDVKPENILVSSVGHDVKLLDFGLSDTSEDFRNRRLGGTPGFSAPEVTEGDVSTPLCAASDLFSAGKILKLLFPKRYAGVVRKCCCPDPRGRYQDISELRRALLRRKWASVLVPALLLAGALVWVCVAPEIERKKQEAAFRGRVDQVVADMQGLAADVADSLSDRSLVPYLEIALDVRNTFVMRTVEYRATLDQDLLPVCDSVYARLLSRLTELMMDIPSFNVLGSQGEISK